MSAIGRALSEIAAARALVPEDIEPWIALKIIAALDSAAGLLADRDEIREGLREAAYAWEEGVAAERHHQAAVMTYAHWSHIGKALPPPLVNPYRERLAAADGTQTGAAS